MNNLRGVQINKYVSMQGICSRREADEWIKLGRVRINGKVAKLQNRVQDGDRVTVDDEYVGGQKKEKVNTYMLFYKQAGLTTTTDENDRTSVTRFIDYHKRIFPVGRLDKDSEGLLILTDDGDIVNKILRAGNRHDKEYVVEVDKVLAPDFCALMSAGIPILGTTTLPCVVKQEGSRKFRIILQQGLNRQIRRMCEYLGYTVKRLTRVRIMHLRVDGIRPGTWRLMTPAEWQELQKVLTESKNEVEGVRGRDGFSDGGKGGRGRAVDIKGKGKNRDVLSTSDVGDYPAGDEDAAFDIEDNRQRTPSSKETRNTYWSDRKRGKRSEKGEEQGRGKVYGSGNVVGKGGRGAGKGAADGRGAVLAGKPSTGGRGVANKRTPGGRGTAASGASALKPGGKAIVGKDIKKGSGKNGVGAVKGGSKGKPAGKSSQGTAGSKGFSGNKSTTGGKGFSGNKTGSSKGIKKART